MIPTKQFLERQMSFLLALLLWLTAHSASGFDTTASTRRTSGAPSSFPRNQPMFDTPASTSSWLLMARSGDGSPVDRIGPATTTTGTLKRRAVLAKLFLTATTTTAVLGAKATMSQTSTPWMSSSSTTSIADTAATTAAVAVAGASTTTTIQRLDSLEEALDVIASSCDKRFLHAIVASDYHLLYRGVVVADPQHSMMISIRREPCDLLDPATYGSNNEAVQYFTRLENEQLKDRPLQPSNSHLATTSVKAAAESWGGAAVSIWPLQEEENDSVHFAWKEQGGLFWPLSSDTPQPSMVIIVDGVDCGKQSLDDVLQQDNSEVMFRANRFLAVPSSMDDQLIAKLKGAFLI